MQLQQVMTTEVVTISADESLERVRELFEEHGFHHLLVIDKGRPVGVVSNHDLLRNLSPFIGKINERAQDAFLLRRRAHQIMGRRLLTAPPTMPVRDAAHLMLERNLNCLPVVDDRGHCVGIVTGRDLLRYLADHAIESEVAA
ncbi:MAG: CBS domain-containing protein [Phycisphaerales bacterium]